MYSLLRPFLFRLDPEKAHDLTLGALKRFHQLGLTRTLASRVPQAPKTVMGLTFPNPVGLAAGMDKNGEYIDTLTSLGFGFIEIGTITPRPQKGNPKPRVFRLPKSQSIINRLGFNNIGVDALIENLKNSKYKGILGINIGKNFDTPLDQAFEDYLFCFKRVYPYASYVAINISSPNTKGLRDLQGGENLHRLLEHLKKVQKELSHQYEKYVPLVVKVAPDLTEEEIQNMASILLQHEVEGLIATNTTVSRNEIASDPLSKEGGGLSGAPLKVRSTEIIRSFAQALQGKIPIIGVGGVMNGKDAHEKISAGADLIQIYTGFVYKGPKLIREIVGYLISTLPKPHEIQRF